MSWYVYQFIQVKRFLQLANLHNIRIFCIHIQLERLLTLRNFCDSQSQNRRIVDLLLNDFEWTSIAEILQILEPFYKYTIKLQSENCTLSDFFGFWTIIRIKLGRINHPLSQLMLDEMNDRHTILCENPAVLGAVYLDPRYQRALTVAQKQSAIIFLLNVHDRIQKVKNNCSNATLTPAREEVSRNRSDEDLSEYLDSLNPDTQVTSHTNQTNEIEAILKSFDNQRQPMNISILNFWREKREIESELFKIASAVYTILPTQSSVERAFSAFALVLTPHRTRMRDETLQNIL